jgi:hypothetical protein
LAEAQQWEDNSDREWQLAMVENDNRVAPGDDPEEVENQDAGADPTAKQKAARSLADKVEDAIRALLNFVQSYIHTLWFALSPKRLQTYDSGLHSSDKLLIRPLTFLCCSFVPSAVILDLSADTIWDFLLDPERSDAGQIRACAPNSTETVASA